MAFAPRTSTARMLCSAYSAVILSPVLRAGEVQHHSSPPSMSILTPARLRTNARLGDLLHPVGPVHPAKKMTSG